MQAKETTKTYNEVTQVKNCPIVIVSKVTKAVEEDGSENTIEERHVLVLGKYRVCDTEFESVDEAKDYLNEKTWELIINCMEAVLRYQNEETE